MNRLHATHRKDLLCIPDPVKLEVGDPNGLSQPLVMAVPQALHKLAIREAICDEPWPVLLVEAQLLNAQALQALPASSVHGWILSDVLMQTSFACGMLLAFMKLCAMAPKLSAGRQKASRAVLLIATLLCSVKAHKLLLQAAVEAFSECRQVW